MTRCEGEWCCLDADPHPALPMPAPLEEGWCNRLYPHNDMLLVAGLCALPQGHDGDHVATFDGGITAVWHCDG